MQQKEIAAKDIKKVKMIIGREEMLVDWKKQTNISK